MIGTPVRDRLDSDTAGQETGTRLAVIAMVALISAGCSSAPAETGSGSSDANGTATNHAEGGEVRRVHAQQRRQRVPGPGRVGQAHHRCGCERLVG